MTSRIPVFPLVFVVLLSLPYGTAAQDVTVIRAGKFLDVETGTIASDVAIVVRGNRIAAAGRDVSVPPDATIVDLSDFVVLPGLIDAHTHLLLQPGYQNLNPILFKSVPYRTVEGAHAARETLEAGFTTVRDVDSEGAEWADVALRDGIEDGLIPGPRLQVATRALSITGGYMNQVGLAPEIDPVVTQFGHLVDSPEEIVKEIRREVKYGTDWIKLYATGTTRHIDVETMEPLAQFSYDEMKLAVDEAARFGIPVAAHAYGGQAAKDAIRAGVRSIEHGFLLDDEAFDMMVERGTFWVPTISVYFPARPQAEWNDRERKIVESHRDAFVRGLRKNVKIAYGTDAGAIAHGSNAMELETMVEYGMSSGDAIRSATVVAAELMGLGEEIGTIAVGKRADVIAVAASPLDDVTVLQDVRFVMKDGVIYKLP